MNDGGVQPPPLEPADVYLYAHGNGAVFLYHPDARSRFVPLAEALEVAGRSERVFLAGDAGQPLADAVLATVRGSGTTIVDYEPPVVPYEWHEGADALMMAAAYGQDAVLDDLLDRGADVHATNDKAATALHHAAAAGNLHAIDRLLAAGADPDARNDAGLTPHMAAQACREHEAALRLEAAGATPAHAEVTDATFRWSHRLPFLAYGWTALVFAFIAALLAAPGGALVVVVAAVVAAIAGGLLAASSLAVLRGIVPRAFDGRRLRGSTALGRGVEVDLDTVTAAAYVPGGGVLSGRLVGSKLVLLHPEGRAVDRAALRRLLRTKGDDPLLPDGARVTVVLLDPWWEHEVLRPVGNRLISDPVAVAPVLRARLQWARRADPAVPAGRPQRG